MSKQDRQGVRTPADVERKYNLSQVAKNKGVTERQELRINQLIQSLNQFIANITAEFNSLSDKFVEKVLKTGSKTEYKTLSDNDLTDELKANYDKAYTHSQSSHAPDNAQANVIEAVKVNGTILNVANKTLEVTVPTKVSQLENDNGYAKGTEIPTAISQLSQDATHRVVTDTEKATWNAKSNFSGKYEDLSGKPTIPTIPSSLPANGGNADTVDNKHIVVSSSAPTVNDTNIITLVI